MNGKLFVVATPIGNSEDITLRAKRVLSEVDIIAAEDTRTTQILLRLLGIKCKMISNHKFNERHQIALLLQELMEGKKIAVVSDAGTPCISDPGSILVEAAVAAGIPVEGVCGANAAVTALSISGFKFVSFSFYGFLPRSSREIKDSFGSFAGTDIPVAVYFESPNRIKKTMSILEETLPDASVCLCNDLTKKYERIYRGSPSTVLESLDNNEFSEKGEYTLVVYHPRNRHDTFAPQQVASDVTDEALLVDYMIKHGCSLKQAITGLAKESVRPKKALYAASLQLKALFNDNLDEGDKFGQ